MTADRFGDLDLRELAEDIAADRRTLSNVIDQIAAAEPDDAARRHAVSELQTMVMALVAKPAGVPPRPEPLLGRRVRRPRLAVEAGTALLAVAVVAFAVVSQQTTSLLSSATAPPAAATAAATTPSQSPPATPSLTPTPSPANTPRPSPTAVGAYLIPRISTESLPGAWRVAFSWASSRTVLNLWTWNPATDQGLNSWFAVDVDLAGTFFNDNVSVLVSPDGSRVAVNEHGFTDPQSLDRVRVFDATGIVLWTSPAGAQPVIDMAWSPDGTELALGSVPAPWVVLIFSPNGSIDSTTYDLPGENAYRLLGFAPDDARLIGYESSGEAEFWEKPVALDLARGTIASIVSFPAGMQSNSTQPPHHERYSGLTRRLEQINLESGDVLALGGAQTGDPQWLIRHGTEQRVLDIKPGRQLAWGGAGHVVSLGLTTSTPPEPVAIWSDSITGTSRLVLVLPVGAYPELQGVRGDQALLLLKPQISGPGGDLGWSEAVVVDLRSGRTNVVVTPGEHSLGGLHFAGWIRPSL